MPKVNFHVSDPSINIANSRDKDRWQFNSESPPQPGSVDDFNFNSSMQMNMKPVDSNFTWEIINLGLEEPLPPQETIDELYVLLAECSGCNAVSDNLHSADTRFTLRRFTLHYLWFTNIGTWLR